MAIKDVALRAGVSVTTVSHVLNDLPGKRISETTRERVRQAATELGYAPHGLARGLRLQRSQVLALISDEIAVTPYAGRMILGAQERASADGWLLVLVDTNGDPEVERAQIHALRQRQVDGFLYATMYHRRVELPAELAGTPTVLLDAASEDPRVSSVVPDEARGGRTATAALTALGHRRIGFLNNIDDIPATQGRLAGYRAALVEAGIAPDDDLVALAPSGTGSGYAAARRLLAAPERPTALFCFNDRMAMGAYQAAADLGLRIPEDLSVVGFDNQELIADGLRPRLTTVALPHHEMGVWAVDALIREVTGSDHREQATLACPLVPRESTAPPRNGEPVARP